MPALARPVSGHVFRVERTRGPVWYAKYRLPDGRQIQRKLGPAWIARVEKSLVFDKVVSVSLKEIRSVA